MFSLAPSNPFSQRQSVLPPFKVRQVHGIYADGKIFTEPLGCLACLCSWMGEPRTLQAMCLFARLMSWPLLLSMAPIVAPVLLCVSHYHCPQHGVPNYVSTKGEQSQKTARILHNITQFCTCEPTSYYGNNLSDPVSRL